MTDKELLGRDRPVATDNGWQRHARRLQSDWRELQGLAPGLHLGQSLASRLELEDGRPPALRNYMTEAAKSQVLAAVAAAPASGALLSRPRLWVDLLSSQPLCFNAFGDLAVDLALATRVLRRVLPDDVETVEQVAFEYSPGRSDYARYTGSRSAFDIFVVATGRRGRGFLGIEVKYAENMSVSRAEDRGHRLLAEATDVFRLERLDELERPPLQQLWLDHLLALRMVQVDPDQWRWGKFITLYPTGNIRCDRIVTRYRECIRDESTFSIVTLEHFTEALLAEAPGPWPQELRRRYLGS
ncbi:MAG: hypothetical protein ABI912_11105 [Actinomycetota bacterium]